MNKNARQKSLYGAHAAVVSGHHLATQQAKLCLEQGGSLVDAMIAASAILAVVLPHAGSLGGCGMMLYFEAATGQVYALNGTGRAPLAATPELFAGGMPRRGARAAVVPTLVRLWARAHERFGSLDWPELLAPAIGLAEQGAAVAEELARNLSTVDDGLKKQPGFSGLFSAEGRSLMAGEILRQPQLSKVLRAIAVWGERGFYTGTVAQKLVRFSARTGGLFTEEDFATAQADWQEPWSVSAGKYNVIVMPPNSVGVLMLQQLQLWQQRQVASGSDEVIASIEAAIAVINTGKRRIGDRQRAPATPADFSLDAASLVALPNASLRGGTTDIGDTTGFVAMDAAGNALALLQSVFQPFGSGAVDDETGILLNNRMFDFSHRPGEVNSIGPGVRPAHTLNPWLILDNASVHMVGVSPGGVSQTTTGFQVISAALSRPDTLGEIVSGPRWSLSREAAVLLEPGMPQAVADALRDRGHRVEENSQHEFYFGSVKVARRTAAGWIEAVADSRRQAVALAW